MIKNILLFTFISFATFFTSCRDSYNVCSGPTQSSLNMGFYQLQTSGLVTEYNVPSLSINRLPDVNFYNSGVNIGKAVVLISSNFESASFTVKRNINSLLDTIKIKYTNLREIPAVDCGLIDTHDITDIKFTTHDIKNVISSTTNRVAVNGDENLKIIY